MRNSRSRDDTLARSRSYQRSLAHTSPLSRSYRSRSPSVAHRARPREDRHWRTARTITVRPYESSINTIEHDHIANRTRSTHRDSIVLKGGVEVRPTPGAERTLSEDAGRRWSATAEDHLSTAVGQRWPEPITHAQRALDPQFPQGL